MNLFNIKMHVYTKHWQNQRVSDSFIISTRVYKYRRVDCSSNLVCVFIISNLSGYVTLSF